MSSNKIFECESGLYEKHMSDKFFNFFSEIVSGNNKLDLHFREFGPYVYFCIGPKTLLNSVCVYNAFAIKRTKCCGRCEGERGDVLFIQVDKDKGLSYYCPECFIDELFGMFGLLESEYDSDEIPEEENLSMKEEVIAFMH